MTADIKSKIQDFQPGNILLFVGALVSILWSVYFSVVTILIPYQIELREGAAQVVTKILLGGGNPYTFENQPLAMNIYGLGYNLVVLPFAALFGNTLLVHRSVTFAFIVLSSAIAFISVYKSKRDHSLALVCSAFVMIALIAHGGIGAFSSAMGTFLFLTVILVPFFRTFDYPSLVLSAFLALAAYYTKPYFVLSFGIVASFLFLFVSKKKAIIYTLLFLALFVVAFVIVRAVFPLYFFNVMVANISMSWPSNSHLLNQLSTLLTYFYPVLFLAALLVINSRGKKSEQISGTDQKRFLNISEWQFPLLQREFDYYLYFFICSLLAFLFILGRHQGNNMNYAYQLLVPTFLCWFFRKYDFRKGLRVAAALIVVLNLFMLEEKLLPPSMLEQKNSKEWAEFFSYIRSSSNILNSQIEASEVVRLGLDPIDTGQTIVYYLVGPFSNNFWMDASYEAVVADGFRYVRAVDRSVEKQKYDLVVLVKEKGTFYHTKRLEEYYFVIDEIVLDMPQTNQRWTVLLWKPKLK